MPLNRLRTRDYSLAEYISANALGTQKHTFQNPREMCLLMNSGSRVILRCLLDHVLTVCCLLNMSMLLSCVLRCDWILRCTPDALEVLLVVACGAC